MSYNGGYSISGRPVLTEIRQQARHDDIVRFGRLLFIQKLSYNETAKRCGVPYYVVVHAMRRLRKAAPQQYRAWSEARWQVRCSPKVSAEHKRRKVNERNARTYARNRERVLRRKRERYATDPATREAVKRANLRDRERNGKRRNAQRNNRYHQDRTYRSELLKKNAIYRIKRRIRQLEEKLKKLDAAA